MATNPDPLLKSFEVYKRLFGKDWIKKRNRSFLVKQVKVYIEAARIYPDHHKGNPENVLYRGNTTTLAYMPIAGVIMEHIKAAMDEVGEEVKKTTELIQGHYNDLLKTHDLLTPNIAKLIKNLREKRSVMAVEVNKSIATMKDVRKFFLDKEHKVEMARLKEFVELCERMHQLIENGTLDAVSDIILKLEGVKDNG